jgi:tRNA A37 threonylcarbamoyladenosine biosynthesis protein TsaE
MSLTPSQKEIMKKMGRLISRFPIIILKGECCSGKHHMVKEYFRQNSITPIEFDIPDFCRRYNHQITAQDLVTYFDYLTQCALTRIEDRIKMEANLNLEKNLEKNLEMDQRKKRSFECIYIRRIDLLDHFLSDYGMVHRGLTKIVVMRWMEALPPNIKVIASTITPLKLENIKSWTLDLETTKEDCRYILKKRGISPIDQEKIMGRHKSFILGHMIEALDYAQALNRGKEKKDSLLIPYREAYARLSGISLNLEKDVPKPEEKFDLVGMEEILEEIRTSIIKPIELGHPDVPVKKGIILTGQPGTGKTTIGRWLAHELKGKLYLIGGEVGVNGPHFIEVFEETMINAKKNAPSVIFIDDVDTLFVHDDTYRAFLTILDGLDNKERKNVCIIVTCMDLSRIPSSLLRGGRLEMTIFTSLPNRSQIKTILENGFHRIRKVISELMSNRGSDMAFNRGSDRIPDMAFNQKEGLAIMKQSLEKKNEYEILNDIIDDILQGIPEIPKPEISKPEISKPETPKPEISKPEISKPEISKPEISKPEISKPEISKPEISKPEKNKIVDQFNDNLIQTLCPRMAGWNCADINRCLDDVLRSIIAKTEMKKVGMKEENAATLKENAATMKECNVEELFVSCISSIRKQYERCSKVDQPAGIENYLSYYS